MSPGEPLVGATVVSARRRYVTCRVVPPFETSNDGAGKDRFCTDATLITPLPTLGAPTEKRPLAPSFPADATTTTPSFTRFADVFASGESAKLLNASPMLMLTTCAPSSSARSSAAMMMSSLVEPLQPKTRYARIFASGATPVTPLTDA